MNYVDSVVFQCALSNESLMRWVEKASEIQSKISSCSENISAFYLFCCDNFKP